MFPGEPHGLADDLGLLKAGNHPLIGRVMNTKLAGFHKGFQGRAQVARPGRRTQPVRGYPNFVASPCAFNDPLHKVLLVNAIEPAGAHHIVLFHQLRHHQLAVILGQAVGVHRVGAIHRLIRPLRFQAVKHIIRADIHQRCAQLLGGQHQIAGTILVHGHGQFRLAFGPIHVGISRRVDDHFGLVRGQLAFHGMGIFQ